MDDKLFLFQDTVYAAKAAFVYGKVYKCMYCALQAHCDELDGFRRRREEGAPGHGQGIDFPSCMPADRADGCHVIYCVDQEKTWEYLEGQRVDRLERRVELLEAKIEELTGLFNGHYHT
jgi:hypothetical protein